MAGDAYAVNYASASTVATTTSTAIGELTAVGTSITDALTAATGALPTDFTLVSSLLTTIGTEHAGVVTEVKTYSDKCVTAVEACLAVYENSSAEMVAEQKAAESKVLFEHGSALTQTEKAVNTGLNERTTKGLNENLPKTDPNRSVKTEYAYTGNAAGTTTTTTTTAKNGNLSYTGSTADDTRYGPGYYATGSTSSTTVGYGPLSTTTSASRVSVVTGMSRTDVTSAGVRTTP
jgi:hypothetical protein